MNVLILTTTDSQDYAIDALSQGLRDLLGAGSVAWNPKRGHLGARVPSRAELATWCAWTDGDNRMREWGSWTCAPDCSVDLDEARRRASAADIVAVGIPSGDREGFMREIVTMRRRDDRPVVLLEGGDVPMWETLEDVLPDGPWFVRAFPWSTLDHPERDPRAFPLPFSFSDSTMTLLYDADAPRVLDCVWVGSRHGGWRDSYVDALRRMRLEAAVVREALMPYVDWTSCLNRSRVHPVIDGAGYVVTAEPRAFEAAAFGCCVLQQRPSGWVVPGLVEDNGFFHYDGVADFTAALERLLEDRERCVELGRRARAHVFAEHRPIHRAVAFLRHCGSRFGGL